MTDKEEKLYKEWELLDNLWELYDRINTHAGLNKDNNMLEKYSYFIENSPRGRSCTYAIRAKQLFFLSDYEDIKKLLHKCIKSLEELDTSNAGLL